jgi:SAM-dependent methyltransferase
VERDAEAQRLRGAWQDDGLPGRQRTLVDQQIKIYRQGGKISVFDTFLDALRMILPASGRQSLLEVGCSSGYYSEVIKIAGLPVDYAGCDYSAAFVEMARRHYPAVRFDTEDATGLRHSDGEFDIVVSGCCLLHIPEYEKAIAETARVARSAAVFHRTPLLLDAPTTYFIKKAYGVETVEIHFNEAEFMTLLERYGLRLVGTIELSRSRENGVTGVQKTIICAKAGV